MIHKCFVGTRWHLLSQFGYVQKNSSDMFLFLHNNSYTSGANIAEFNTDVAPEITIDELLNRLKEQHTTPIKHMFHNHISMFQKHNTPEVQQKIMTWANMIVNCVKNGHKVLIAGNGGSAADAQHFAAELVVRFKKNRQGIPAIALTTDTSILTALVNDFGMLHMFSRQVDTFGENGDVFIAISTSGNSENILEAIESANSNLLNVIVLTGKDGGEVKHMVSEDEILIVDEKETGRIQEFHEFVLHAIAEIVEMQFEEKVEK